MFQSTIRKAAALVAIMMIAGLAGKTHGQAAPVTLMEEGTFYILDNGIVTAMVDKASGDLVSLKYKDMEMLATIKTPDGKPDVVADPPGANGRGFGPFTDHQYGFWSHDAMGPRDTGDAVARISLNPKSNGGERAEVSIKGISNGRKMGTGPGSNAQGNFISDIEIRWALGRGESGVYTYSTFEHKPEYPASTITEARFCVKLNDFFDWMSIAEGEHHNKQYPATLREGDKYVYTTNQYNNRAFGWSSTTKNVGLFIINPSMEYMSGGPTKVEFLGHRDTNAVAAPCVLNYWRSSHYGGAEVAVKEGESWVKTIGPFMLYVNSGADSQAIYADARSQAVKEAAKWPFAWVDSSDYPSPAERTTVKGQLALSDPQATTTKLPNLMVGLTAPAYTSAAPAFGGGSRTVDWQQDAKHYEFWVRGDEDGKFEITGVRPGLYTMHAFADGVLGEFAMANVTVDAGKPVDFGKLTWTPVRRGKQVWDIGIPNRYGKEFYKGDVYWTPKIGMSYATMYPADLVYTIGKSDFRKDWFFLHVPRFDEPLSATTAAEAAARGAARRGAGRGGPTTGPTTGNAVTLTGRGPATGPAIGRGRGNLSYGDFGGPAAMGKPTTYTVVFNMPAAPRGKATLRFAFAANGAPRIAVAVNDKEAGQLDRLITDGTIDNHGQHGIWNEREFAFDASLMKQGENTLKLTVPQGNVNAGSIYDYLRLELDESASLTVMAQ